MKHLAFDETGFSINGEDAFLISGEFHYFRVPADQWKRRMELLKEAGGNSIATYVPWCIHEPEEGCILFDDIPQRSLTRFLETAREVGLMVTLRPGPYQYSELVGDGLPDWLYADYPELLARNRQGEIFGRKAASYLHPLFLEKARRYYRAFAEVVRPFVSDPVVMLQVDNELTGVHVWFGSIDYNPETYGFGREDGRYARFLRQKYGSIDRLNEAYGSNFCSFAELSPLDRDIPADGLQSRDYDDCYYASMAEYLCTLAGWLKEDGLDLPVCHNSAGPNMNSVFAETVRQMPKPFLLGSDHYYNLHQGWAQNNPTPQYAIHCLYSCEMLRLLGMPPTVLELPGGSPSDTPPILSEDLLACYFTNLAMGMKGMNYYVFTGGPNFEDNGSTCEIYDYNAFVGADGSVRPTYQSLKAFNEFCIAHSWMQRAQRKTSAAVGFEWQTIRKNSSGFAAGSVNSFRFASTGLLYTMMCSRYAPALAALDGSLDPGRPLILSCGLDMSPEAQQRVADFAAAGGRILLCGELPQMDPDGRPCTLLQQAFGVKISRTEQNQAIAFEEIGRVYGLTVHFLLEELPEGARVLAREKQSGKPVCAELPVGCGKVILLGASWQMTTFAQARMLEYLLDRLGAKPCVCSQNRNIFTSLIESEDHRVLFVLNLYSAPQQTAISVYDDAGQVIWQKELQLKAMEVQHFELDALSETGASAG